MAGSFQEFYDSHIGKAYDKDGVYGAQCVDGLIEYLQWLGYGWISGNAYDIYVNRNSNGLMNYCDEVSGALQNGDILFYGPSSGNLYGHVGMYYNGGVMGQNQNTDGSGGPFNVIYPYNGVSNPYVGAVRPKCYSQSNKKLQITCVCGFIVSAKFV